MGWIMEELEFSFRQHRKEIFLFIGIKTGPGVYSAFDLVGADGFCPTDKVVRAKSDY
jgi:hypothetical protein